MFLCLPQSAHGPWLAAGHCRPGSSLLSRYQLLHSQLAETLLGDWINSLGILASVFLSLILLRCDFFLSFFFLFSDDRWTNVEWESGLPALFYLISSVFTLKKYKNFWDTVKPVASQCGRNFTESHSSVLLFVSLGKGMQLCGLTPVPLSRNRTQRNLGTVSYLFFLKLASNYPISLKVFPCIVWFDSYLSLCSPHPHLIVLSLLFPHSPSWFHITCVAYCSPSPKAS